MERFLVHSAPVIGPATHAVVIGVGDYRHLPGGSGHETESHDGMAQLSSPPVSALKVAEWIIAEYNNPKRPLATVSLLLSDTNDASFTNSSSNEIHQVERAVIANVEEAVLAWKRRGDDDEENLMLFFFSGHGIAQGPDTSLLLEDYGASEENALKGAMDFAKLHLGMARCAAKHQLFFVDACRASSDTLIESLGHAGTVIISPKQNELKSVRAPVFYSTVAGAKAFGRTNKPSYFTDALLWAFRGGGADDISDKWTVSTTDLKKATDIYMERLFVSGELRRAQSPAADGLVTFELMELLGAPMTRVVIFCNPAQATETAVLSFSSESGFADSRQQPDAGPWELDVPGGEDYNFHAAFPSNDFQPNSKSRPIRPPIKEVKIEVAP